MRGREREREGKGEGKGREGRNLNSNKHRTCLTCQFFDPAEPGELEWFPEAIKLGLWPKIGLCRAPNLPPWAARTNCIRANSDASGCDFYSLNPNPIVLPGSSNL